MVITVSVLRVNKDSCFLYIQNTFNAICRQYKILHFRINIALYLLANNVNKFSCPQ